MKILGMRHPFFRPLWRRAATTALCFGWALVELAGGNSFWALLFAGIGALCLYEFFIVYDPAEYADPAETNDDDKG